MQTFTVSVAFYSAWQTQTVVVEADSYADACAKAIEFADNERPDSFDEKSWDPGRTFVAGIRQGGDLSENQGPYSLDSVATKGLQHVPYRFSEASAIGGADRCAKLLETLAPVFKMAIAIVDAVPDDRKMTDDVFCLTAGQIRAVAAAMADAEGRAGDIAAGSPPPKSAFSFMAETCPSSHWNRGDDTCTDCGTYLG